MTQGSPVPFDRQSAAQRPTIAVVDYGAGNLVSIGQALAAVGANVRVVSDPEALVAADGLVVPGVGASAPAMRRLRRRGLVQPLVNWAVSQRPLLGICLGLQLLFEESDEDGARTLGLLQGRTVRLDAAPTLPHVGWNQVGRRREHAILDGIVDDADFYFVHSYVGLPARRDSVIAETEHGSRFPSVVANGSVVGVQFHPERSGRDGLRLLGNFVDIVAASSGRATSRATTVRC